VCSSDLVVAGFEPENLLEGLAALLRQIAAGEHWVENVYRAAVTDRGNRIAQELLDTTFTRGDAVWRSLGIIPNSGLLLRDELARFDAARRFDVQCDTDEEAPGCRCGMVLQGRVKPADCPLFGRSCTPRTPVGPCMISSEGSCAAWFKYARLAKAG
jgi:hydrogenase expression/formation protein HypD